MSSSRLSSGFPGTTAGPFLPPRISPAPVASDRPPLGEFRAVAMDATLLEDRRDLLAEQAVRLGAPRTFVDNTSTIPSPTAMCDVMVMTNFYGMLIRTINRVKPTRLTLN